MDRMDASHLASGSQQLPLLCSSSTAPDGPCCPVCLDPFSRRLRPVPLAPCGHALCRSCSRRLLAALSPSADLRAPALRCPLCRRPCAPPPDPPPAPPPPLHLVVVLPVDAGDAGGDGAGGKPARCQEADAWVWTTSRCLPGGRAGGKAGAGPVGSEASGERLADAAPRRDSGDGGECEWSRVAGGPGGVCCPRLRHVLLLSAMLLLGLALFVVGVVLRLRMSGGGDAAPTARGPS